MNKLVRVNLGIDEERLTYLDLKSDEALQYIKKKILEEAQEVLEAKDRKEIIEEVGDLLDVIDLFLRAHNISPNTDGEYVEVEVSQILKNKNKGWFVNADGKVPILDKE